MPALGILFTKPRWSILEIKWVGSHDARGLVPAMQGDGFATEQGRIMKVAMWLCAP